jgi:hypothetical protein
MSDAGIVDKDVESREGGKGSFHGERIRDIRGENLDTTPSPACKGCRFLPCLHGKFQNMHIRPFRGETQGHGPTDAGASSGDYRDFPYETISCWHGGLVG